MSDTGNQKQLAATPQEDLREHLMASHVEKTEVEWYAKRKVEQLEQQVKQLEAQNEILKIENERSKVALEHANRCVNFTRQSKW